MKALTYKKWSFLSFVIFILALQAQSQNRPHSTTTQTGNNNTQYLKPFEAGIYFIKIQNTGKYWGIEGINKNNGARVVQWDFADQSNHKFQIDKTSDGFYTIKALHSGRYLNVAGQSVQDGAGIVQWDFVNQDNMKFSIIRQSGGWIIRGKQSNKDVKLFGNVNNNANGTPLIIISNLQMGSQIMQFEPANASNVLDKVGSSKTQAPTIFTPTKVSFRLPDGTTVERNVNSHTMAQQSRPQRNQEREVGREQTCVDKVARIDMGTQSEVTISSSDYKMSNAPGLMYDISNFYGGDYRRKELFPFSENRNPIVLTASVRNMNGAITETVQEPTYNNINQAISNLYSRFTTNPGMISSESLVYNASAIESSTEFYMKIGAMANYFGGSIDASMSKTDKQSYKYLYFEGTKVMFTIEADRVQQGFFNGDVANLNKIGFIQRASYGVKVVGKVEIKNTENSMRGKVAIAYNTPFVGGKVSLENLKQEINSDSKVFLYVVGGTSNTVTSCTIGTIQYTIDNILRGVNYHTSEPISLTFSNLNKDPLKYRDLTNDFPFRQCMPNTSRDLKVSISNISLIGTDCELYGDVWVELVRPGENLGRFRLGDNRIFKIDANQYITPNELRANYAPNKEVIFKNIPYELAKDAELHVYYLLKDHDDFDDDLLEQRNGHKVRIPNTNWDFYRSEVKLDSSENQYLETEFTDAGNGAKLRIRIQTTPLAQ